MTTHLDHIVVGAETLEQGVDYLEEQLGVTVPAGGEHPLMGTHNRLMKLGNDVFLEVIAVAPGLRAPERPRWYGLDDPLVRQQLAKQPRLLTWVVNTPIAEAQAKTAFCFGRVAPVSRGDLSWLFGLPDDGRLLASGMVPYLIQWPAGVHPAERMADLDCRLEKLELYHPNPGWLSAVLEAVGAAKFAEVKPLAPNASPYLSAHVTTPTGTKVLSNRT